MSALGHQLIRRAAAGILCLAALVGGALPCLGQAIRIRPVAVVEARQDVRLGDIATITAPDPATADMMARTLILSEGRQGQTVGAESILMALMAQRVPGAQNLRISGAAECRIQVREQSSQLAAVAPTAVAPGTVTTPSELTEARRADSIQATGQESAAAPGAHDETLAQVILARVQAETRAAAGDVRVSFQTISPLLESPPGAGRKWLCRPLSRTIQGTVQFEAQLVEATKVVEKLMVQTKVERRQMVVVTMARLGRGEVIDSGQIRVEEAWLDRSVPTLFARSENVIGLEAQRDIAVGSMLDERDFKPALMAHKNELITVIYVSGALQVQIRGRAMEDAKMRDLIQVRNETTGEKYGAVMIAKGLGVAGGTLTAEQEQFLREGLR